MLFKAKIDDEKIVCVDLIFTTGKVKKYHIWGLYTYLGLYDYVNYKYCKENTLEEPFTIRLYDISDEENSDEIYKEPDIILSGCTVEYITHHIKDNCIDIHGEYSEYNEEY